MPESTNISAWLDKFEADGGIHNAFVDRAQPGSHVDLSRQKAIGIYLSNQRNKDTSTQHEQPRRVAISTLDVQQKGNRKQTYILWTLLPTIAVTLLIAFIKNG